MDPRRLLTFRTVARERSFSHAAERLSLSQPSVSHQIALLEAEAGVRLLDRGRGGVRLTAAGEVLLHHADHLAWRLDLADAQIGQLAAERRADLRVGAFPTALAGFVPAATARLRLAHGDLRVRLSEVTSGALEARLLSGEFDVALGYQDATGDRRQYQDARRVDLFQESFLIGLPPEHPQAAAAEPISLATLAEEDWIVPSTEGFVIQACRDAGFEPHVAASTGDPLATRGLITRGLGVGWVPGLLAGDYPGVAVRPVRDPVGRRDIYAVLPPGDRHPLAGELVDALVATVGEFTAAG